VTRQIFWPSDPMTGRPMSDLRAGFSSDQSNWFAGLHGLNSYF
jgi:hypothetical protein